MKGSCTKLLLINIIEGLGHQKYYTELWIVIWMCTLIGYSYSAVLQFGSCCMAASSHQENVDFPTEVLKGKILTSKIHQVQFFSV